MSKYSKSDVDCEESADDFLDKLFDGLDVNGPPVEESFDEVIAALERDDIKPTSRITPEWAADAVARIRRAQAAR